MSNLDLYDDLFPDDISSEGVKCGSNVEVGEQQVVSKRQGKRVVEEMRQMKESNEKLEKELNKLKKENKNWQLVYMDVTRKLDISKKNVTILLKTTRNEINRKNETITALRREMDNVLFKRALKCGTVEELKEILNNIQCAYRPDVDDVYSMEVTTELHKKPKSRNSSNEGNNETLQKDNTKIAKNYNAPNTRDKRHNSPLIGYNDYDFFVDKKRKLNGGDIALMEESDNIKTKRARSKTTGSIIKMDHNETNGSALASQKLASTVRMEETVIQSLNVVSDQTKVIDKKNIPSRSRRPRDASPHGHRLERSRYLQRDTAGRMVNT